MIKLKQAMWWSIKSSNLVLCGESIQRHWAQRWKVHVTITVSDRCERKPSEGECTEAMFESESANKAHVIDGLFVLY